MAPDLRSQHTHLLDPDGNSVVVSATGDFHRFGCRVRGRPVRRMGMTDTMTEPISTRNLDRYGSAELPWSRPRDILASDTPGANLTFFVASVRPDGRPHSAGVGAVWVDGALYFTSGPGTRKSRNLATNPACSVSVRLRGIDLVLEGEALRVTDASTLERVAAVYRTGGWPASVEGDALTAPYSAPSAGPAPWYLYRLTLHTAVGVAGEEPHGATRWDFAH
jgi:Pyridoxamine 5'-phosphate oxidase